MFTLVQEANFQGASWSFLVFILVNKKAGANLSAAVIGILSASWHRAKQLASEAITLLIPWAFLIPCQTHFSHYSENIE